MSEFESKRSQSAGTKRATDAQEHALDRKKAKAEKREAAVAQEPQHATLAIFFLMTLLQTTTSMRKLTSLS